MRTITALSFDQWFALLEEIASDAEWSLGDKHTYREYFDDGDTPAAALVAEMRYASEAGDVYEPSALLGDLH